MALSVVGGSRTWWNLIVALSLTSLTTANEVQCPLPCHCENGEVDCTQAGLKVWPTNLPANTTTLILSRNQLKRIPVDGFYLYPRLKVLDVSNNQVEHIDGNLQLDHLEKLDLSHNAIRNLVFLHGLPKLRHLDASYNQLNELENNTFIRSTRLHWLRIDSNPIKTLPASLFRRNEMIGYLSLSNLEVESLPPRLLDPMTRLQQLEVRDNYRLDTLRDEIFHYLGNSLRHLNLANNSLSSLPRSLRQLDALRTLNLDGNPFQCDCQLFWFANWLEKRSAIVPSNGMFCLDSGLPLVESLWKMHCSAVRLETSTLFQEGLYGQPVVLTCNFSGNPQPSVTWVTPDRTVLRWPSKTPAEEEESVALLSPSQLQINTLSRHTAGDYACHASNALSNVTAFMRIHITPKGFRRVQIHSIIAGFTCVGVFVFVALLVQGFRYLMDRFGWWECCYCCGERLSPRAKQIRNLLEAIEQYKSQQLERLRENYTGQVHRIRENCVQQMERIHQGYAGQVKYLRGVRVYGTQQLTTIREQYNDQAKKVYDYTVDRLQTVQRNYVSQRSKVRKFSAHQLIRLREKYQFQQKTLNKIMENLPAFYLDSCRSAACARTDSVYFQDVGEVDVNIDVVESIIKQGIQLDLPDDICLEDENLNGMGEEEIEAAPEETETAGGRPRKRFGHGRQASAGSLDLSFLFAPIRFPSLNWRRRNTVDEETKNDGSGTALEVAVEICPVPVEQEPECNNTLQTGTPAEC
ncbi:amphoterin-induced protein 3-like [Daphnia carinata]|uniref:amphoterin-induced protein 3-like n=1 Tax=Daphnia carinata TaxID=120202 RepID=UPI00257FCFD7|nr:amphoterin-induced protein 3-like [Daphnia carinata]